MKLTHIATILFAGLAWAAGADSSNADVPTIEVFGNKFFYSNNGSQFYIKGIAYQQDTANASSSGTTFVDPLADGDACKRDLPYLQQLHTNTLRVYAINTTASHKECMDLFAEAGIYVIADLSQPSESINRDSPEWNLDLFARYKDAVDSMSNFTNVLGFFAGNEVTNNVSNTDASAFVKAAVRDTKTYIKDQGYRSIPVGYSSNDDSDTRVAIADYFACGGQDEKVDFYGINMYEWCGDSSFAASGYEDRTKDFANLSVPLFFSEYGCNEVQPREFTEVAALYGSDMTDVWSGGIVYMYFEEANNYGLVSIDGDSVSTLDDFGNLASELASVNPSSASASGSQTQTTTLSCPASASTWKASSDLPPTPDESVCKCLGASLNCVISSDVHSNDYGDLYGTVCGLIDCSAISANGTSGEYGDYSYCDDSTKLSYLLNLYYEDNGSHESDCSFDGSASLMSASSASSCSAVLAGASGSVSAGSGSSSGSHSSGSGSSSSGTASASGSTSSTGKSSAATVRAANASNIALLMIVGTIFSVGLGAFLV